MNIAILDDEPSTLEVLNQWLIAADYKVSLFESGKRLQAALARDDFDLLLLDWMVPDISGLELLRWVREQKQWHMPVIFTTGKSSESDIVSALQAGADDYMKKPIGHFELLARIEAVTRRLSAPTESAEYNPYRLDFNQRQVYLNDDPIKLTDREFLLFSYLLTHSGRVLSREKLLLEVWGVNSAVHTRTVDTHASSLRRKLKIKPENGWRLASIYQYGYRLEKLEVGIHVDPKMDKGSVIESPSAN